MKVCSTCNRELTTGFVEFKCPNCGKERILRCPHCRKAVKTYKCGECGFEGP
ncbi:MAG TPA: zinc finger domain-containing protein [archaeon]|nr:zinc finger domain-containing protein [archaeon]